MGQWHLFLTTWGRFFCPRVWYSAWSHFCTRWLVLRYCLSLPQFAFVSACFYPGQWRYIYPVCTYSLCPFAFLVFIIKAPQTFLTFILLHNFLAYSQCWPFSFRLSHLQFTVQWLFFQWYMIHFCWAIYSIWYCLWYEI